MPDKGMLYGSKTITLLKKAIFFWRDTSIFFKNIIFLLQNEK